MSANAACETQVRCHQIKVITAKRSKLTIRLFKAISGKFISILLFPVTYDMINFCKTFYIRYKMRGTKHPWVHEEEFKVLENSRCKTCIQLTLRVFFLGGVHPLLFPPWRSFLNNSQGRKLPWEYFGMKEFGNTTFCACVNMPFLTQGGIYRPEFLHENNHPVSQVLGMRLSWNSPREPPWPKKLIFGIISHFCWCQEKWFLVLKYTWVTWHGWWHHQLAAFIKGHPWRKFQLYSICRTWDTRGRGCTTPLCITGNGDILVGGNTSLNLFMEAIELLIFWCIPAEHDIVQL